MNYETVLLALSAGVIAGCAQPAATPNVDVQLPEQTVGRWSIQVLAPESEYGSTRYLALDSAAGTICVLERSDIEAASSLETGLQEFSSDFVNNHCKKLPK